MRRALLLSLVIVSVAGLALAQPPGGYVGAYSDPGGTDCFLLVYGPIPPFYNYMMTVFYFYKASPGAIALEFQTILPDASSWSDAGASWEFALVIGNPLDGVSFSFGDCLSGDIYLGYQSYARSTPYPDACQDLVIQNHPVPSVPGATSPIAQACPPPEGPGGFLTVAGSTSKVNGDQSCPCTVPVEDTSWGKIKALYE